MSEIKTAPFRADHVGSLLRPDAVKAARKAHYDDGTMEAAELAAIEDEAIRDAVAMQEAAGLKVVTDGEIRRTFWHFDFMGLLTGQRIDEDPNYGGIAFKGASVPPVYPVIHDRLDFPADHPHLEHFKFLASVTKVQPKISIPGPSCTHFRTAKKDIHVKEYIEDRDALFHDLAATYKKAVEAFYAAGCRYLQMDDIFFAYLCDPKIRAERTAAGEDPDWLIGRYAWMMNEAIKDRPADMKIGMHLCRGNFKSTWAAEGAYDLAADAIFNQSGVDIFFMEYDTDRAGGLEPLRLLPKGSKRVMPGFITTKTGDLESVDDIKAQLEAAAKYCDIDQLGIAPQCGFASTEHGNSITADDQRRKLELVVKVAQEVWGES